MTIGPGDFLPAVATPEFSASRVVMGYQDKRSFETGPTQTCKGIHPSNVCQLRALGKQDQPPDDKYIRGVRRDRTMRRQQSLRHR